MFIPRYIDLVRKVLKVLNKVKKVKCAKAEENIWTLYNQMQKQKKKLPEAFEGALHLIKAFQPSEPALKKLIAEGINKWRVKDESKWNQTLV